LFPQGGDAVLLFPSGVDASTLLADPRLSPLSVSIRIATVAADAAETLSLDVSSSGLAPQSSGQGGLGHTLHVSHDGLLTALPAIRQPLFAPV